MFERHHFYFNAEYCTSYRRIEKKQNKKNNNKKTNKTKQKKETKTKKKTKQKNKQTNKQKTATNISVSVILQNVISQVWLFFFLSSGMSFLRSCWNEVSEQTYKMQEYNKAVEKALSTARLTLR